MISFQVVALSVGVRSQRFRFNSDVTPPPPPPPFGGNAGFGSNFGATIDRGTPAQPTTTTSSFAAEPLTNTSALIWQPLRATFRPLNRSNQPPEPLELASTSDFESVPPDASFFSSNRFSPPLPAASNPQPAPAPSLSSLFLADRALAASAAAAAATTTTTTTTSPITIAATTTTTNSQNIPTTRAPLVDVDEELPTRVPLNRFRPTKAPSVDPPIQPALNQPPTNANSGSQLLGVSNNNNNLLANGRSNSSVYRITNECFECICEASTSCNVNSRCQTSDVRHTRCGMMLISYDQWLETGLSRQLVSREALARDPAANERAFYECVTERDCAERLLSIYMQKNARDCDKDGRVDCYDVAAIHQGGVDQCQSENLLDSQYWSDFNACFGFGR